VLGRGPFRQAPLAESAPRLEAEAIRDTMLQISGLLDPQMFERLIRPKKERTDSSWREDESKSPQHLLVSRTKEHDISACLRCTGHDLRQSPPTIPLALPIQSWRCSQPILSCEHAGVCGATH